MMMDDSLIQMQAQAAFDGGRKLPSLNGARTMRQMRDKAQEFEAQFLAQMLQPMFKGLDAEAPFGGGHAEEMWRGMQVEEYGKAIAKQGGIGIADMVLREMIKAQEGL